MPVTQAFSHGGLDAYYVYVAEDFPPGPFHEATLAIQITSLPPLWGQIATAIVWG